MGYRPRSSSYREYEDFRIRCERDKAAEIRESAYACVYDSRRHTAHLIVLDRRVRKYVIEMLESDGFEIHCGLFGIMRITRR